MLISPTSFLRLLLPCRGCQWWAAGCYEFHGKCEEYRPTRFHSDRMVDPCSLSICMYCTHTDRALHAYIGQHVYIDLAEQN